MVFDLNFLFILPKKKPVVIPKIGITIVSMLMLALGPRFAVAMVENLTVTAVVSIKITPAKTIKKIVWRVILNFSSARVFGWTTSSTVRLKIIKIRKAKV